jgi:hypothetical protein
MIDFHFQDGTVDLMDMNSMRLTTLEVPSAALPPQPQSIFNYAEGRRPPVIDLAACSELPKTACLVKDGTEGWAALTKWTFDFFKEVHGHVEVSVTHEGGKRSMSSLRDYLDSFDVYRLSAEEALCSLPGQTPYLRGWTFEEVAPSLSNDFCVPSLFKDFFEKFPKRKRPPFHWLFLGPRGSCTPLHIDPSLTHAWLAQIHGRKRFILFPPEQVLDVWNNGVFVDIFNPDMESFPKFSLASAYEVVLEPGDMLFIPSGWAHHVSCIDDSISLTFNFLPENHFSAIRTLYLMHVAGRVAAPNGRDSDSSRKQSESDSE